MIVFITSVRHPHNSNSYLEVCRLLKNSLRSVLNQSDQDYRVIVVCNELPVGRITNERIDYVLVDFAPPSTHKGPQTGKAAVRKDKGCKFVIGIIRAQRFNPDYIMFFDADDFIHRDIATYCNARKGVPGFYVASGYVYQEHGMIFHDCPEFNRWCGTCNILSPALLPVPDCLHVRSTQDEIIAAMDDFFLTKILGSHPFTVEYFARKEIALIPIPFRAAIYVRGTGETQSNIMLRRVPKILSGKLCEEFGISMDVSVGRQLRAACVDYPIEVYRVIRSVAIPYVMGKRVRGAVSLAELIESEPAEKRDPGADGPH